MDCVLARLDARPGVEIAFRERVQTRLGQSASDELPAAAIDAALRAARRFMKPMRHDHAIARVLPAATAAVRDASNRGAVQCWPRRQNEPGATLAHSASSLQGGAQ